MAALKFESVSLGEEPPKVHGFRMISSHRLGGPGLSDLSEARAFTALGAGYGVHR